MHQHVARPLKIIKDY